MKAIAMAEKNHHTILVVEDYAPGMMVTTMMLEHLGYDVDSATCGREAVAKVCASNVPFLAILMDVNLDDMDGFAVTQSIRAWEQEQNYRQTIIALTAHALAGDRERCLSAGMDDYISKPIAIDLLAKKLTMLAEASRRASA